MCSSGMCASLRLVALVLAVAVGLPLSAAAQTAIATAALGSRLAEPHVAEPKARDHTTNLADPYYVEFRSRYAQSYGHAFVVFGRGKGPGAGGVLGFSSWAATIPANTQISRRS